MTHEEDQKRIEEAADKFHLYEWKMYEEIASYPESELKDAFKAGIKWRDQNPNFHCPVCYGSFSDHHDKINLLQDALEYTLNSLSFYEDIEDDDKRKELLRKWGR